MLLTRDAIGVSLNVTDDGSHLDDAAELEALGFGAIWLPGGQLDRLARVGDLVRATQTIPIATAVIPADVHPAAEVAGYYAELEAAHPGRFLVGLGGSQRSGALAGLGRYLDELDATDPPVPVGRRLLAALGPRKLDVARQRCAGAMTLLVTPAATEAARTRLGPQARLVTHQLAVLEEDAGRARASARNPLRFLSSVAGYRASFAREGFSAAEIDRLDDRLVDAVVVWGDEAAIVARLRAHLEAGADEVVLSVRPGDGQPGGVEVARRLIASGLAGDRRSPESPLPQGWS